MVRRARARDARAARIRARGRAARCRRRRRALAPGTPRSRRRTRSAITSRVRSTCVNGSGRCRLPCARTRPEMVAARAISMSTGPTGGSRSGTPGIRSACNARRSTPNARSCCLLTHAFEALQCIAVEFRGGAPLVRSRAFRGSRGGSAPSRTACCATTSARRLEARHGRIRSIIDGAVRAAFEVPARPAAVAILLIDFFLHLGKAAGQHTRVALDALKHDVVSTSIDDFLFSGAHLPGQGRGAYENILNLAFGAYFKGVEGVLDIHADIPESWLRKMIEAI